MIWKYWKRNFKGEIKINKYITGYSYILKK